MKPDLQRLPQPWMTDGPAAKVVRALTAEGDQARFVGGCVRDALVGRTIRDIDITTPLSPQRVTELLHKAGLKAVPTGIDHGTVTAVADKTGVEVTTLRLDVETDGRRAKVAFTDDWQADAARRDLTINALSADADGTVHDYFGGLEDLAAGRVRFVGDPRQRITEDYLRLLRFFRFHADYAAGEFDPAAVGAAQELAPNLKSLSGERLRQETLRLLTARRGVDVWGEMLSLGIVQHYLPWATSLDRLRWVAELEQRHGLAPDPIRRLAALTMTGCGREVAETLRLSRAEGDRIIDLDAAREPFDASGPQAVRRQIYAWGNDGARDRLLLDWLDRIDGASGAAALAIVESWPRPRFPIKGADIVKMGVSEGPRIGELLEKVENWWVDRDFAPDRAACLVYARNHL
ncbi:CCA tRNA nucleotidyltransferase [Dongia deserti]|uniref:CCA tRNA nucleotidyltransferase n=1 Tax=Dongia deserti TaxID=2268030 RepID=UPI000E65982C|nr:CCA tRNA nucleotidyltransferase [Dongia deserti]